MLGKYIVLALSAVGFAAAASTKCAAQAILDKCLQDLTNIEKSCSRVDYKCLCQAHKNILTCYNNCPDDNGKLIEESNVTAWCVAAGGGLTTTAVVSTPTAVVSSTGTGTVTVPVVTGTATGTTHPSGTGSATGSHTGTVSPTPSGSSDGNAVRPVGMVAAAIVVAGWLL